MRGKTIRYLILFFTIGWLSLFTGSDSFAATAVETYGALKVSGTKLVSRDTGEEVVLRGVSTHGINWDVGYPYISKESFKTLRDSYGVNAIRLAMYTTEYFGYCDKAGAGESQEAVQNTLKQRIDDGVNATSELGMYVIIDWHILNDKNPNKYKKQAKSFFTEMSKKYAGKNNVIYEICNEPNGETTWEDIKKYANEVIPVIRENAPSAVIIVGTPTWSQDVDVASRSPLNYDNLMYTLHFYSATHRDSYRDKLKTALNNGLPVMVTEYGVSEASGGGNRDTAEAKKWLDLLDEYKISYFAWSLSNKDETCSLLKSSTHKTSGWKSSDLSPSGKWVFNQYVSRGGKQQNVATSGSLGKVSTLSLKNVKGKKLKVSFKKVNGAEGYEVSYGTSKNFANKKTKKVLSNKNSYTFKKLKKGKNYYVRVRAYKTENGEKSYGSYCAKKKIKIKK